MIADGLSRREWLLRTTTFALLTLSDTSLAAGNVVTPEQFGAIGDGRTSDTMAFAAMSAFVNRRGGGAVELTAGKTYIVGDQSLSLGHQAGGYSFPPAAQYPIDFNGCTGRLVFNGNGARIKCKPGAKFGTFNDDGTSKGTVAPYLGGGLATPYFAIIRVTGCSGGVRIENVELDGSIASASIGGEYDDNGRQIGMSGVILDANTSPVELTSVKCHHHGLDGIILVWAGANENSPRYPVTLIKCAFISNGRQGMSWVGGKGVTAINCRFNNNGKDIGSMPYSLPGAGLDIEAEASICRNGRFMNCEFSNNSGAGLLSVGDTADVVIEHCKLIGTTSASIYGGGPRYRFNDCTIVGQVVNPYPNPEASIAARFRNSRFLFGTGRSPTGTVYALNIGGGKGYMIDAGGLGSRNILFDGCRFDSEGNAGIRLGYTADAGAIYRDCTFIQDDTGAGFPRGKFYGFNKFISAGFVDLSFSRFHGQTTVNGIMVPRTG